SNSVAGLNRSGRIPPGRAGRDPLLPIWRADMSLVGEIASPTKKSAKKVRDRHSGPSRSVRQDRQSARRAGWVSRGCVLFEVEWARQIQQQRRLKTAHEPAPAIPSSDE